MPAASRTVSIAVPPPDVMALLTDFPSYPSFLPDMQDATVLRSAPGSWEVRFTLQVIRRLTYTLKLSQPDPLSLRWSLVEGLFRANVGGWRLEPVDDGQHTEAHYEIDIQLGVFVPGNIIHSLVDKGLPDTLDRFRREALRRQSR